MADPSPGYKNFPTQVHQVRSDDRHIACDSSAVGDPERKERMILSSGLHGPLLLIQHLLKLACH